jgi:two-component system OmpR family sensor kinase
MRLSLRSRLGATYAIVAAAMLVGAYLVAERAVDGALVASAAERLEIEAGLVVADSASGRATATDLAAGDVARILGGYGTAVAIVDASGQVLAAEANGADPTVLEARLAPSDYASVIASGQTVHAVRPAPDGGRTLVVAAPLQLRTTGPPSNPGRGNGQGNGQGVGQGRGLGNQKGDVAGPPAGPPNAVAQLAISLDGIDETVAGVRWTLQVAALVLLLVAGVAVWLVTSLGLRPLERVSAAARRIAAGDLAARASLPAGGDEVGRLGRAFDGMADRVDATLHAQRAFAADASHELRSPLTVLGGYVDVMARTNVDEPTRSRMLTSMRSEIDRLSRLSTDLLLLTQLEAGGGRLAPREIDVAALVEDVGDAARIVGDGRRVEVRTNGPVRVLADQDRLTQAVINLVDNAVRHTPSAGDIVIAARSGEGWAAIEVSNTGTPIADADLPRVFDRFYCADRGDASNGHHAGLGLAIVKAIADASGGSVHVSSADARTTFQIRLPLAP